MSILQGVLLVLMVFGGGAVSNAAAQPRDCSVRRGAEVFGQCGACHSATPGVQLTGPSLAHIWGRHAGTVDGFTRYSEAMRGAAVVWDERSLDRWLTNPQALIPGTVMTFTGIREGQQRADLIAYLKALAAGQARPPAEGGMMAAAARPDLNTLGPERRVKAIRHCGDGYHVTTEDGRTIPFWEFNLRFKTDSGRVGPSPGKPVLLQAGMQGDRASIVFSSPAEISRLIEERC